MTLDMYWANFLHIYQPARQAEEIFDRAVNESYRPLIAELKKYKKIKINLNINGALGEQFARRNYKDVLDGLKFLSERGQIEFTDSAKYHALLPFLPTEEIERQIKLNRETNRQLLGASYDPKGFFPPEMAYAPILLPVLEKLGYEWVIIDEIGLNGRVNQVDSHTIYKIKNSNLKVFFRERNPSNVIMSALIREKKDFIYWLKADFLQRGYMITGMDGETFGHHRPGLLKLLIGLLRSGEFEQVFISELPRHFGNLAEVEPVISTWASTEEDIEGGAQFISWRDPENPVHAWQWELQNLALSTFKNHTQSVMAPAARQKLDEALASDHFFWASGKPWWSLEMVELGAWSLLDAIKSVPWVEESEVGLAQNYYNQIVAKIFEMQRSGYIRELARRYKEHPRIPFKERTADSGEPWVYNAFISLLRQEMRAAAKRANFEEATLWRDAIWKLETKNDVYDTIHAVDLLRKKITEPEILDVIEKYRRQYEKISSGQPEHRGIG